MGLLRKRSHKLEQTEREFLGRTGESIDLQIVSATGSRVIDAKGRSYIDLQMGWCVGNLGWNHPAIVERLRDFTGPSYVAPQMRYEPWVELARQLAEVAPGDLSRVFRAVSGTEAVEQALQIAQAVTGRTKHVGLANAYHGNSLGVREHVLKQLAPPFDDKALDRLETHLKRGDVAAFVLEPIVINLGVEVPTEDFMRGARELCDQYDTLLVFDEVATGFGRTGRMFATEYFDVVPDIMTLGKAITNGHAPLAATITTPVIADALDDLSFYSTFGWHPLAVEAALANLEYWRDHHHELVDNIDRRSGEFLARLIVLPWQHTAEIRIKGLAIAIKLEEDYVSKVVERCRERGLLVGDDDEHLVMYPALTLDDNDTRDALDILERAVSA